MGTGHILSDGISTPTDMTSPYLETFAPLSVQSLRRPLFDEASRQTGGNPYRGISQEAMNELACLLQDGDEQDRELVEACIGVLILRAMEAQMLEPRVGHAHRLANSLQEAVDRFNRYIR